MVAIRQTVSTSSTSASGNVFISITANAGSILQVLITYGATSNTVATISDGTNNYGNPVSFKYDSINGQMIQHNISAPVNGGTYNVIATYATDGFRRHLNQ